MFAFSYHDEKRDYVSYKTRLTPFLQPSRWGDFLTLWKEMLATIENALENWDEPSIKQVKQLLLEEYDKATIEAAHNIIDRCIWEVMEKHRIREVVLREYRALGTSILEDKSTVMRALSERFPRNKMKFVYSVVVSEVAK